MQITDIKNAVFANAEHSAIDCEILIGGGEWLPFTASYDDIEQHGRDVFAAIIESGNVTDYIEPEPQPEPVPQTVTMRQARLALHAAGLLTSVAGVINDLDEPLRTEVDIEWEYSQEFKRDHTAIVTLASGLGLDSDGLDQLFIAASKF